MFPIDFVGGKPRSPTSPVGKSLGSIVITVPSRSAYDTIIAGILADTALTSSYGKGTITDRDAAKDSWNVRLKIREPSGETYYLNFTRNDLRINSYENDDLLTKVDTWTDGVASLNQPPRHFGNVW